MNEQWVFVGYEKPFAVSYYGYFLDEGGTCKAFVDLAGEVWLWNAETSELSH